MVAEGIVHESKRAIAEQELEYQLQQITKNRMGMFIRQSARGAETGRGVARLMRLAPDEEPSN